MRVYVAVSLVAALAFAAGRFSNRPPVEAQQIQDPTPDCADLNGDGEVNITDAVHLLSHLFLGGPAPECAELTAMGLPDTGQTRCYDSNGDEIECSTSACPGQDGFYSTGCASDEDRFVDNMDGTVTDTCTGLMWQKGSGRGERGLSFSWCEALMYCEEELELGGHQDWRLPNIRELQSIVDYGRSNPAVSPVLSVAERFSDGERTSIYWSSTMAADPEESGDAWCLDFIEGALDDASVPRGDSRFVKAVRDGT